MKDHGCISRRQRLTLVALLSWGLISVGLIGCGHESPEREAASKTGETAKVHEKPATAEAQTAAAPGVVPSAATLNAEVQPEAQRVLDAMVAAYRQATSYSDQGYVRLDMKVADREIDERLPFSVAMVRPNQLRMDIYTATLVCDGHTLRASLQGLAGQVLQREAPSAFSLRSVYCDPLLGQAMHQGPAGGAPQLPLLVDPEPLKSLLQTARKVALLQTARLGEFTCDRVSIVGPEGTGVWWIDQQSRLLRRVELPVDDIKRQAAAEGKVDHVTITAELADAQFDGPVEAKRFQFDAPSGAKVVKLLVGLEPGQLLGKKVPPFKFFDLSTKPITADALAGKVLVIEFWGSNCPPCRASLPNLEKVYQKYKSHPRVAFLCVNVDPPMTKNDAVAALYKELGATAPLYRDPDSQVINQFYSNGIPTMFLVGSDGLVEDFEAGANPDLPTALPQKLEKLLAGQHLYEQAVKEYQERLRAMEAEAGVDGDAKPRPAAEVRHEIPIPATQIAAASPPRTLKLKPLWKATDVKTPGNVLVVPRAGGTPQIFVISDWRSVVEIGSDGRLVASRALDLPPTEVVSFLRTVEINGRRWYAASTGGMQQVHVYDENWKPLCHFPTDAAENKHAGISDTLLADLNGDGTPLLLVGYWGPAGVQGVSLEGKRLWANRSIENVFRLAVSDKDAAGKRTVLCLNSRGTIVALDGEGTRKEEIAVGARLVQSLVGADLAGNGKLFYCGLTAKQLGVYVALGIDLRGKELWSYDLPPGQPGVPIEQIIPGQVTTAPPGQWLLPAADGSIHILTAEGRLLDQFNYGAVLCGLATTQIAGKPVLLVATAQGLEALEVSP
jgi:cytochrome c biogenesis protein CcmG/thiol:disulfide interchange protein DsbE